MIDYGKVKGSIRPSPIEITATKVFVASNIIEYVEDFDGVEVTGFEYDYVEYNKDEYIQYIGEQYDELQTQLLNTQLALCDIYESIGGWLNWLKFIVIS